MLENLKRIAVLMPRADVHTRGIFAGITRFARPLRAWQFHMGLPDASIIKDLRRWQPHGIIATIPNSKLEKRFQSLNVPLVNCSSNCSSANLHRVITDNHAVGKMAAIYLIAKGYKHLAYCGESHMGASRDRQDAFIKHASSPVHLHEDNCVQQQVGEVGWRVSDQDDQLRRWLTQLPKPAGILACHDPMAMVLIETCRQLGIDVPGELAVLGVDNDQLLCEMAYPTLSSIEMAHERIGFEAARILDQLMTDTTTKPFVQTIKPLGIVTRQSTDGLASADSLVGAAVRFIHEHADHPIRVMDVVQQSAVSRRNLEMRFESAIGKSILQVIQQAHIKLAQQMLTRTHLPIEEIAPACGFNSRERFSAVFHEQVGLTPARYRQSQ